MKKVFIYSIALLPLILSNCASILGYSNQNVTIKSEPSGAEVTVDGMVVITPATIQLKGKREYYISASKKGYRTTPGKINGEVRIASGIVGNIFNLSGIIGLGTDFFLTGAGYKLNNNVNITLLKETN